MINHIGRMIAVQFIFDTFMLIIGIISLVLTIIFYVKLLNILIKKQIMMKEKSCNKVFRICVKLASEQ